MTIKAQILEDNGGGIHWATDDGRSCSTNGITKSSSNAGALVADLVALEDWIDDTRNDRPDEADTVEMDEDGMTVIAEMDDAGVVTIYTERMGASGRAYAGTSK